MDLTKEKIPKLIRKLAIPASIGFFFETMYNVVDTFYAGMLSTVAIAALSLSFPIFFIMIAIGIGISQGSASLIANAIGEKNRKKARFCTAQSLSFSAIFSVMLTLVGLLVSPFLFGILGASGEYMAMSLEYINIVLWGTIFIFLQMAINSSLNAQGDMKSFRNILIAQFFINIVLNPLFMFGWFGIPKMGIAGLAIATVAAEFIGFVYLYWKLSRTKLWQNAEFKEMIPKADMYSELSHHGFPASINMLTVALGIFVITFFVSKFGQNAVAAYGIATRIEQIALLPSIGISTAVLSISGQNNGAKLFGRLKETWVKSLKYGILIIIAGGIMVFAFAGFLMRIFTENNEVIEIGKAYLPIATLLFPAYIILFISTSLLQGMKKPMFAVWIGLYRQILALIVLLPILAFQFGIVGIWWGVFSVNWSAAIFAFFYAERILKKSYPAKRSMPV